MKSLRPFIPNPHLSINREMELPSVLDIEIGAGVGFHAIQYAKAFPHRHLIAIEKTQAKFDKFQRRFENHSQLKNLTPVHANAIDWISSHIPPESVENYFLLYPNPYPKNSQKNKRWHQMPFMTYLLNTLKVGGQITLATNMSFYYDEAKSQWLQHPSLKLIDDQAFNEMPHPRTHFEKKYLSRGESCYQLIFEKTLTPINEQH